MEESLFMETSLSIRLREGTKESHRLAEQSPFIQKFFKGELTIKEYRTFLLQLLFIYQGLEDCHLVHNENEELGKVFFPELFRSKALQQDLNFYYGNATWKKLQPNKATRKYLNHITSLSVGWVEGLIPHLYTRYLGDLSGGQALKRIVAKTFNLTSTEGVAFYDFPQIENLNQFKDNYRSLLDSMNLDEATVSKLVDEANLAFQLNRDIFDSLMDIP
jgi:heme oxygenase